LNSPLVDRSNVSTRSKLHLQPMTTRLSYLLNPFLLATALTNEISSSLYINQFGSISTSFWRYPLKSVRRKALGWISYFTPSSSSAPPNVFSCDSGRTQKYRNECEMPFVWVQKATDGLACKLWNHCSQSAKKYIPVCLQWSIRNEFQYKDKQDFI